MKKEPFPSYAVNNESALLKYAPAINNKPIQIAIKILTTVPFFANSFPRVFGKAYWIYESTLNSEKVFGIFKLNSWGGAYWQPW